MRGGARRLLWALAALGLLASPASALAFSFGIGIEGGGNFTYLTTSRAIPDLGLILTQRFELGPVDLTLWEDANALVIYDSGWYFTPIDVGLRVGLPGAVFRPYIGLLMNDSISAGQEAAPCASSGCNENGLSNVPGIGGDLGFDLAVAFLRFGLELRACETLVSPVSDGHFGDAFTLQALLSARAEF